MEVTESNSNEKDVQRKPFKKRLNIWMREDYHDELAELAKYEDRTVSDIVRQLVVELLNNKRKEAQK